MATSQHPPSDGVDNRRTIPRFIWLTMVVLNVGLIMLAMLLLGTQMGRLGMGIFYDANEQGFLEVEHIYHNSPAEKAGLQPGDRIIAINGDAVEVTGETFQFPVADAFDLRIERDGARDDVQLVRAPGWFDNFSVGALNSGLPLGFAQGIALVLDIAFFVLFLGVSAMLFWTKAESRMMLLIGVTLLFLAVNFSLGFQALYDEDTATRYLAIAHFLITILLAVITLLMLPDGDLRPQWAWALPVILLVVVVGNLIAPGVVPYVAVVIVEMVVYIMATVLAFMRYRGITDPQQRGLMRHFLIGVVLMLASYVLFALADYFLIDALSANPRDTYPYLYFYGSIFQMLLAAGLPISMLIARRKGYV